MKKINFNDNWTFYNRKGIPKTVNLPHDAMLEEKRDPNSPGGSAVGFFPPGEYIYEKTFIAPEDWIGKFIAIQFEGIYKDSRISINGNEAGGCRYGYIPFSIEATCFLKYGQENTIRVEVDNKDMPNSRWYTGAGIYRPVWMWVGEKKHIKIDGIKISTLSYNPARIYIEIDSTGGEAYVDIAYKGKKTASASGNKIEIEIPDAKLWSAETPELYECHVTLKDETGIVDEARENFGIRKVEWSNKGLFINGKETLLRGGCIHHDNGILGARCYRESEERRVRIMKQAGYNAIRCAHNPASKSLLEACDRFGMYVMDETWDMWYKHKNKHDYASNFWNNYKNDIKAMVDQDFNHPSVIMYSIGNEISEPCEKRGIALAKEMTEYIHFLDSNRAVTCGVNLMIVTMASKGKGIYKDEGGLSNEKHQKKSDKPSGSLLFNMMASMIGTGMNKAANSKKADAVTSPVLDVLDIAGYNYASGRYPKEGELHPNRIIVGSETFPQDIAKNWSMVKKFPYLIGDFMWTAWDYLGETGIGAWSYTPDGQAFNKPYPWLLADVGAIDILGNIGAEAEYAATVWGLRNKPYIAVRPLNHPGITAAKSVWRGTNAIPSWSWKNCEGNKTIVEVYSNSDIVELFINGKSIGKKKTKNFKAYFKVKYTPGNITAAAYNSSGTETGRTQLLSAAGKIKICLKPEKNNAKAGEIVYVDVSLIGENGIIESNADAKINVFIENGELLAFGSANPRTEENYLSGSFTTYYGRALAVVLCKNSGKTIIHATALNMEETHAEIVII